MFCRAASNFSFCCATTCCSVGAGDGLVTTGVVGGLGGLGFCAGAATRVVGSTLPAPCCSAVGAGVAPPWGVGDASAVGEADGCDVAAPEVGGGVVSAFCAPTRAPGGANRRNERQD